jgi:hypothetical protein
VRPLSGIWATSASQPASQSASQPVSQLATMASGSTSASRPANKHDHGPPCHPIRQARRYLVRGRHWITCTA